MIIQNVFLLYLIRQNNIKILPTLNFYRTKTCVHNMRILAKLKGRVKHIHLRRIFITTVFLKYRRKIKYETFHVSVIDR